MDTNDGKIVYLARMEWDLTDDLHLHVIRDETTVDLHEGDEFLTVELRVDPFEGRA